MALSTGAGYAASSCGEEILDLAERKGVTAEDLGFKFIPRRADLRVGYETFKKFCQTPDAHTMSPEFQFFCAVAQDDIETVSRVYPGSGIDQRYFCGYDSKPVPLINFSLVERSHNVSHWLIGHGYFEESTYDPARQKASNATLVLTTALNDIESSRLLLENGASPNGFRAGTVGPWNKFIRTTALNTALNASSELALLLLDHGADPNIQDDDVFSGTYGRASLNTYLKRSFDCQICQKFDIEIVHRLLKAGADPNGSLMSTEYGPVNALFWASLHFPVEVVKTLVEAGANPYFKNQNGITSVSAARKSKSEEKVKYLCSFSENRASCSEPQWGAD